MYAQLTSAAIGGSGSDVTADGGGDPLLALHLIKASVAIIHAWTEAAEEAVAGASSLAYSGRAGATTASAAAATIAAGEARLWQSNAGA